MRNRRPCFRCFLVLLCILLAGNLFAQTDRATIEGIITDASGASVAAAEVQIVRIKRLDRAHDK